MPTSTKTDEDNTFLKVKYNATEQILYGECVIQSMDPLFSFSQKVNVSRRSSRQSKKKRGGFNMVDILTEQSCGAVDREFRWCSYKYTLFIKSPKPSKLT